MNLLSAPLNQNLVIKNIDIIDDVQCSKFGIMSGSVVSVVNKVKKVGIVIAFKKDRMALDEFFASKINVVAKK